MKLRVITRPGPAFMEMILARIPASERQDLQEMRYGAAGLCHGNLLDLFWAADIVEKACTCHPVLVQGSCPQHIQMLAFFGKQSEVAAGAGALKAAMEANA